MATRPRLALIAGALLLGGTAHATEVTLTEGTNFHVDVSPADGRLAIDLLQRLWIIPARGGEAVSQPALPGAVAEPRWSPDGRAILFQAIDAGHGQLWLLDMESGTSRRLSNAGNYDQDGHWHPSGTKIVFVSGRGESGLDLWEHDIETGIERQLTNYPGNETDPAWSADGSMLAYVRQKDDGWSIVVRNNGIDSLLVSANNPLSVPSWRPDNTLLIYQQQADNGASLRMAIMSDPPLLRDYSAGEDLFAGPVTWQNRSRFYYAADGIIKQRNFDARLPTRVPFRARIGNGADNASTQHRTRHLSVDNAATLPLVIRARRVFDGVSNDYQADYDIHLQDGRIKAVVPRQDWPGVTVLDLGNVTVLPGLIDSYARLQSLPANIAGPLLLSFGVTTLVAADSVENYPLDAWQSSAHPGPRILRTALATDVMPDSLPEDLVMVRIPGLATANNGQLERIAQWRQSGLPLLVDSWQAAPLHHADLLLGIESIPRSRSGRLYQDLQVASGLAGSGVLSGMADGGTPGLTNLLQSRQSRWLPENIAINTRFPGLPEIGSAQSDLILASYSNGLPAGLALHAEFLAMQAAGLAPGKILHSAGSSAARALGYEADLGRIQAGALADLVVVDGDPLQDPASMIRLVAVVRNGHFFSLGGLLDRIEAIRNVE